MIQTMSKFNTYMAGIDADFYIDLCHRKGKLRQYKKNEYIQKEGDIFPFCGLLESGIVKYTCLNVTEGKDYNIGFSFPGEFVADYPFCLYGMKAEISIQAVTDCKILFCHSDVLNHEYENTVNGQILARTTSEQLFNQIYLRYINLYRYTPEERYIQLIERYPDVIQLIPLKEIASYLKITPIHLSRIRRKQTLGIK